MASSKDKNSKLQKKDSPPAPQGPEEQKFPVVGIGASAGGLEALEQFFEAVPADCNLSFVVVTHQRAEHHSLLPGLIQKKTNLPVQQAEDGQKLEPGQVYLSPPDKELRLMDGILHLLEPEGGKGPPAPIDSFFASLAQDQGEWAVGVVLSGMGSDGSQGLRQIKGELGMVVVQTPESARYRSMPDRAIETGAADFILPPEEMPDLLLDYAARLAERPPGEAINQILQGQQQGLRKIFLLLQRGSGHDFSGYKPSTVLRRLDRRLKLLNLETLDEYSSYLQRNPQELQNLQRELLINVTSFFRDPAAFETLRQEALLPLLRERAAEGCRLRVWVVGCATGEEAYSLAMLIQECFDELKQKCEVQIFATDLDKEAVEHARQGVFASGAAAEIGEERLRRFFTKENGDYRIRKWIRSQLIFAVQNVVKDPPFTKVDLICCRNVLIYMGTELQRKLLPLLHYSLMPNGFLFLGTAETIGPHGDLFAVVNKKWKLFRRKEVRHPRQVEVEFPLDVRREPIRRPESSGAITPADEINLADQVHRLLLKNYVPSSVLVDRHGDVYYFHGRTGRYLEPPDGQAIWNVNQMARKGLEIDLAAAIRLAVNDGREIVRDNVRVQVNGGAETIRLRVLPFKEPDNLAGLLLVMFEPVPSPAVEKEPKQKEAAGKPATKIAYLEQALQRARENLQTVVEELESSNEELKSTNEEYQSANEELQSTNEELESSREELQSLNEELVNVNTELQARVEEADKAFEDMRNFLDSLEIPTIFLDNEMRVQRFSANATRIVSLIDSDVGRPIEHLQQHLEYPHMVRDARYVVQSLRYLEKEVRTRDGHWYRMRIMPHRKPSNVIEGVVIIFFDIHEEKTAGAELLAARESSAHFQAIVNTMREPLLLLDENLVVTLANSSFYRTFREEPNKTIGRHLYELGKGQWNIPGLRKLLEEVLPGQESFDDFEVEQEFPGIGRHRMLLNGRRLRETEEGAGRILLAIEDITDRVGRPKTNS
ncbi:MAG: chemotaxis protein CheB [Deltaproteobacteria bacterium]